MSNKERTWGPIVHRDFIAENKDKIMVMIDRLNDIRKNFPMNKDETIDEYNKRRQKAISDMDKKIQDEIYAQKQRKMHK